LHPEDLNLFIDQFSNDVNVINNNIQKMREMTISTMTSKRDPRLLKKIQQLLNAFFPETRIEEIAHINYGNDDRIDTEEEIGIKLLISKIQRPDIQIENSLNRYTEMKARRCKILKNQSPLIHSAGLEKSVFE